MTKPTTIQDPIDSHHEDHRKCYQALNDLIAEFTLHFPDVDLQAQPLMEFHNWALAQYYEPDHDHDSRGKVYMKEPLTKGGTKSES